MPKGKEVVELWRPGAGDRYGGNAAGTLLATLERCIVTPRTVTEQDNRGVVIIEGYTIWVPPQKDDTHILNIAGTDRVRVRGKEWQLEGTPADHHKPSSGKHLGFLFVVQRVA